MPRPRVQRLSGCWTQSYMTQPNTHNDDTFEVISTYTDAEAIADGNLIEINKKDRATRAVWDFMKGRLSLAIRRPGQVADPAPSLIGDDARAKLAFDMISGIVRDYGPPAAHVYNENLDGGIWKAKLIMLGDDIIALAPWPASKDWPEETNNIKLWSVSLWLMPNEIGGMTLMFPEDY